MPSKWLCNSRDLLECRLTLSDGFLTGVPVLFSLTKYQRAMCADSLTEICFEDGTAIVTQDEAADAFFIIKIGEVICTQKNGGVETELRVLGCGDYFGEIGLMAQRARVATCTAKGPTTCLRIPAKTFDSRECCLQYHLHFARSCFMHGFGA
eukprot:SAG31_NODE_6706_length_1917_cov_1.787679_2_plen_152_part_00